MGAGAGVPLAMEAAVSAAFRLCSVLLGHPPATEVRGEAGLGKGCLWAIPPDHEK